MQHGLDVNLRNKKGVIPILLLEMSMFHLPMHRRDTVVATGRSWHAK
jgi:hypothetical protein